MRLQMSYLFSLVILLKTICDTTVWPNISRVGEFKSADSYADMAIRHNRYNAKALVNKGNCLFMSKEYERAKEIFLEAIGVEVRVSRMRCAQHYRSVCSITLARWNQFLAILESFHRCSWVYCWHASASVCRYIPPRSTAWKPYTTWG